MVFAVENLVADYAKAGAIVELDPYINSPKNGLNKESLADIYKPYLDSGRYPQYGNKTLSFPFFKSLEVLYRNDDLAKELGFTAPPKTWDEFEKQAKAALKTDASGVAGPSIRGYQEIRDSIAEWRRRSRPRRPRPKTRSRRRRPGRTQP